MTEGTWALRADTAALANAGRSWDGLATVCSQAADSVATAAREALSDWDGFAATAFDSHRTLMVEDLDEASTVASEAARAIDSAVAAISGAQARLTSAWLTVSGLPRQWSPYGQVFVPESEEDSALIKDALETASQTRSTLDEQLGTFMQDLAALTARYSTLTNRWTSFTGSSLASPQEGSEVGIIVVDGQAILSTGSGDDEVTVTIDPETGEQIVSVRPRNADGDGETREYRLPADLDLTIRAGAGRDMITLPSDTSVSFRISGGTGMDVITAGGGADRIFGMDGDDEIVAGGGGDYVSGGGGHDYIEGQSGNDTLIGGSGRDTLYGLDGQDRLAGGSDQDYLEGGGGRDYLTGGDGDDVLSGGRDNDEIFGGRGDDVSYGGHGTDRTVGGTGQDTSHDDLRTADSNNDNNVNLEILENTEGIRIEGSPEFVARVEADLDLLRSSPAGQAMLLELQENYNDDALFGIGENSITIRDFAAEQDYDPHEDQPNSYAYPSVFMRQYRIDYLPTIDDFRKGPPMVVLQHELAHTLDYGEGTTQNQQYEGPGPDGQLDQDGEPQNGVRETERQAAGLPIDDDNDPATPEQINPDHRYELTENGLREEMGLPLRESYREPW
ncbi:MAG: M91 family zinc metallopeptidase [Beutenbergiaceae bacterium]